MGAPAGFETLETSPFNALVGPLYIDRSGPLPVVGLEVLPQHLNTLGRAHGGLLMTLADVALSRAIRAHLPQGAVSMATADLHVAFLDAVAEGTWLQAQPTIDRTGRSIIHASCVIVAGDKAVAKALGTWAVRLPGLD